MRALRQLALAGMLSLLTAPSLAQLVNDGETNVISGTTNITMAVVTIGSSGSHTALILTNAALLTNTAKCVIGDHLGADSNYVWLTGSNTGWLMMRGQMYVGYGGAGNQLIVSNGATVLNGFGGYLGYGSGANNNVAVVTGAGSAWSTSVLYVGLDGSGNRLVVSDGGVVRDIGGFLGRYTSGNEVVVTGAGSLWSTDTNLYVGFEGSYNTLVVSNGGTVFASNLVSLGDGYIRSANRIITDGGTLRVANAEAYGVFEISNGTNQLCSGLVEVDHLLMTSTNGVFEFNGGTLRTKRTVVGNGKPFIVGNGVCAATLQLLGGSPNYATHIFTNGLLIQTNATLTGTGTINGALTNCGTIFLTNADLMTFNGPVVNKGVIVAVTGLPHFNSTFTDNGLVITTLSIRSEDISVAGSDVVLRFNTVSNRVHEIQASSNLTGGAWLSLTNGIIGTGGPMTYTNAGGAAASNRTYRIKLVP